MRWPPVAFVLRRRLRRSNLGIVAIQITIALLGSVLIVMAWSGRPTTSPAPQQAGPVGNAASDASAAKVVARMDAATPAANDTASNSDIAARPAFDIGPPVASIDGTSVRWNDIAIRLHGIEGPRADQVCLNEEGHRWACGLQARAALHNLAARTGLRCQPVRWAASGEMEARCDLQGAAPPSPGGLARQLVLMGWARPAPGASDLSAEAEQARSGRLGLWRGGWTITP